jgi:hypothetical protein
LPHGISSLQTRIDAVRRISHSSCLLPIEAPQCSGKTALLYGYSRLVQGRGSSPCFFASYSRQGKFKDVFRQVLRQYGIQATVDLLQSQNSRGPGAELRPWTKLLKRCRSVLDLPLALTDRALSEENFASFLRLVAHRARSGVELIIDNFENLWDFMTRWQRERFFATLGNLLQVPRLLVIMPLPRTYRDTLKEPKYFPETAGLASLCLQPFVIHYTQDELKLMVALYAAAWGTDIGQLFEEGALDMICSQTPPAGDLLHCLCVASGSESQVSIRIGTEQLKSALLLVKGAAERRR